MRLTFYLLLFSFVVNSQEHDLKLIEKQKFSKVEKSLIEDLNRIILQSGESLEGNIFYEQGLGVLTKMSASFNNIQFQNSYILYEQNMVCRVKDYEFNTSYNPTLTTGSLGFIYESSSIFITSSTIPYNYSGTYYTYPDNQLKDFATASYFTPYVGSLGFYNDSNQLLAIAKMSQPVPLSNATDLTFLVKLDW